MSFMQTFFVYGLVLLMVSTLFINTLGSFLRGLLGGQISDGQRAKILVLAIGFLLVISAVASSPSKEVEQEKPSISVSQPVVQPAPKKGIELI